MAIEYRESIESREIRNTRDGLVAIRVFIVKSDDPDDKDKVLDTEAIVGDPGLIPLGTEHPALTGLYLKEWSMQPSEALNHGLLTYTYARSDRGGNQGGGISTPDSNGEIWTFNLVSQTTQINQVKSDAAGNPQQKTYSGQYVEGAQKYSTINFDEEQVNGTEVYRPAETVNVTKVYDSISTVSQSYRQIVRSLQNKVNDDTWPTGSEFKAGELLFLGADFSYNIAENTATVNYSFLAGEVQGPVYFKVWQTAPTYENQTTTIKIEKIYPFQVVWAPLKRIEFAVPGTSPTESQSFIHAESINVADVYEPGDFTQLLLA